jgi:hypothetical protein
MDVASDFQSKIMSRQRTPEEYRVYRAGLEWDLTDPIVIERAEDFKSTYRWRDRLTPYLHQVSNLITFCRRLPVTLLADDVGLGKPGERTSRNLWMGFFPWAHLTLLIHNRRYRRRPVTFIQASRDASDEQRGDPMGKSPTPPLSSPFRKNILIFRRRESLYIRPRPAPHEGRSRSSRTWGGMRWTRMAPLTNGV